MVELKDIADNIIKGNAPKVKELVEQALDEEQDVEKVLKEGLIAGMNVVGKKFKNNEFYVPEVLIAARRLVKNPLNFYDKFLFFLKVCNFTKSLSVV